MDRRAPRAVPTRAGARRTHRHMPQDTPLCTRHSVVHVYSTTERTKAWVKAPGPQTPLLAQPSGGAGGFGAHCHATPRIGSPQCRPPPPFQVPARPKPPTDYRARTPPIARSSARRVCTQCVAPLPIAPYVSLAHLPIAQSQLPSPECPSPPQVSFVSTPAAAWRERARGRSARSQITLRSRSR